MRISFWTGWLDPQMVAVSKEVHQLMDRFPGSCAFGLSRHYWLTVSLKRRSFGVNTRLYPIVRPFLKSVERRFDITHVYTSLGDWHFLNALGERPIVLTLTQKCEPTSSSLLGKVSHVVAETKPMALTAIQSGISPDNVSVIYPGVDLRQFVSSAPPPFTGTWKCLFASSPENESEINSKGVDLILAAAKRLPNIEFTILWRPFGPLADIAEEKVRRVAPSNVVLIKQRVANIHELLGNYHFSIAPFKTVGKPCPNSILEMLAVGRPVVVSDFVDIGELIEGDQSGLMFDRTEDGLCEKLGVLCRDYPRYQANARKCAETHFDFDKTTRAYCDLYKSLV